MSLGTSGESSRSPPECSRVLRSPSESFRVPSERALAAQVDARSLELLCEDLGSASANQEFNDVVHGLLGVAEQVLPSPPHPPLDLPSSPSLGLPSSPPSPLRRRL